MEMPLYLGLIVEDIAVGFMFGTWFSPKNTSTVSSQGRRDLQTPKRLGARLRTYPYPSIIFKEEKSKYADTNSSNCTRHLQYDQDLIRTGDGTKYSEFMLVNNLNESYYPGCYAGHKYGS